MGDAYLTIGEMNFSIGIVLSLLALPCALVTAVLALILQALATRLFGRSGPELLDDVKDPTAIVILVHGTFAKKAPWTFPPAPMTQSLKQDIGNGLLVVPHAWSGRNSFSARRKGALGLLKMVRRLSRAHPDVPLFLIGHSHGGSICYTVSGSRGGRQLVDGITTLSTPFIQIGSLEISGTLKTNVWIATFLASMIICMMMFAIARAVLGFPADLAFIFSVITSLTLASMAARRSLLRWKRFARRHSSAHYDRARMLILRTSADEAGWVIGLAGMMSWIANHVHQLGLNWTTLPIELVFAARDKLGRIGVGLVGMVLAAVFLGSLNHLVEAYDVNDGFLEVGEMWTLVLLALTFGPLALYITVITSAWMGIMFIAAALFAWIPIVIQLVVALALGKELLAFPTYLQISAEPTPPGTWEVTYITDLPQTSESRTVFTSSIGVQHSRLYNDPATLARISDWLRNRIASCEQHARSSQVERTTKA